MNNLMMNGTPVEKRTKDIDLIADLTCLIHKYEEDD